MPTGPLNRVADNSLASKLLGWEPKTAFADGLKTTLEWYFSTKDVDQVRAIFDHILTGRGVADRTASVAAGADPNRAA
jgi:hypothetical protein